jgi:outer membrane protein
VLAVLVLSASIQLASAETLQSALTRAYAANPTLSARRASVRVTDENVASAKAGYRPRITGTADAGLRYTESSRSGVPTFSQNTTPYGFGLGVEQTLFNGFRTDNTLRQAEAGVLGAREALRNQEQTTLFEAASAYMNVLRDTAVLNLERNNVTVIEEQLRQVQNRFTVGELTRTDVSQAQARLALSQSRASLAESNLRTSIGRYRQVVGIEPQALAPGRPIDHLVPRTFEQALRLSQEEHPAIKAALHALDVAELQVRIAEGELCPTLTVSGDLDQRFDVQAPGDEQFSASVVARLVVPIYEGGEVYARTRQAKETAGQRRLEADSARDQVRSAVLSAWGQYEASEAQIAAAEAQVQAGETAL